MKGIYWDFVCWRVRTVEAIAMGIAFRLPRSIVYWAAIRLGAHATCGPWANESPTELLSMTALKRWRSEKSVV